MTRQLLKGIRVLDFTDFLAGPYCGMYLADMGADVIKVENLTTGGNFVRNARPLEKNSGLSMYFQNLNRNKRGVAINLKTEDGKKLFSELVKSADVLLENNRPGVMGRLGFSYEECKKLNPRLVYASISGFGQYGPNANRPGYDLIGQAMGGSMSITGWPGSEPTRAGMAIGDLFGGLNAGFAICASLYNREKTGVGNHIDVALVDSIFSGMEAKMMQYPRLRRAVHCGLHPGRLYLHRRRHHVTVNNIWGYHIFPFLAKSLPSRGLFVHFLGRFCNSHRFARISPPGRKIPPFRGYYGGRK